MKIGAIILAAGSGSRMGLTKQLLKSTDNPSSAAPPKPRSTQT